MPAKVAGRDHGKKFRKLFAFEKISIFAAPLNYSINYQNIKL
jgi:hypothetical protein